MNGVQGSGTETSEPMEETLPPIMPHLTCSATTLNQLYPRVEAPSDQQLEDMRDDRGDGVFQHGLRGAAQILEQSQADGRKRRPEEPPTTSTTPTATTTTAPTASTATSTTGPTAYTSSRTASSRTTPPSTRPAREDVSFLGVASGAFTGRSAPGGVRGRDTFLDTFDSQERRSLLLAYRSHFSAQAQRAQAGT